MRPRCRVRPDRPLWQDDAASADLIGVHLDAADLAGRW
jgi:hypothetical protein